MKTLLTLALFLSIIHANLFGQKSKDSLFVFVGQKIKVDRFYQNTDTDEIKLNGSFKAKYKVIQNVFGSYCCDTIEFEANVHEQTPSFSNFEFALLYIIKSKSNLYFLKYNFTDVYKTTDGRWAGSYRTEDYIQDDNHKYNNPKGIAPEKISFIQEVAYSITGRTKENVAYWFPSPYYKIQNNKAIAIWGNYVEQLFELKKMEF